ncbi:MAG TPA: PKD domain-containing protein, partial [Candidatus Thalassarchaeaceae archaeon]|nr:PKD domain-containing protein [Candidatus Thalassarchaeaceae archaeon]
IEVEIYSEDAVNWTGNDSSYFVEYSIENNSTITPILIRGCMDEEALNFKPNATEDDGSCVFPQPEPEPEPEPTPPDCLLCNLTYYIPSEMSVGTTDTFYVVENSGDGWKYFGEANVSWNIDGVVENGSEIEYSFTAIPELGHASVSICASFSDGSQDCIWEEITVNQSLNGYISQSGVLEPIIQDNVGGVHFNVTALGGLAPYSFEWQFGDGNSSTSSSLVYEFADWGIYDVTLVITDARMDTVNLQTQVEIKNSQGPGDDPTIVDKENVSEPEVTPFGAVATGGGTLLLVMLSRHNSRKQKEKILVAARAKLQNAGMGNEETLGVDDFEGNWD